MKKRVLFSHSYFYRFDPKQWRAAEPYPPLMTMVAAALMRAHGYEVQLFDVGLRKSPDELLSVLESFQPDYFVIFDDGFNYLTKMCLTTMREAAFAMQKMAKTQGARVITCSSDSTDHAAVYLEQGADFVIRGEGEVTLLELIQAWDMDHDVYQTKGIYFSEGGELKSTLPRPVNTELDELPQAAWDLVDIDAYRRVWLRKHQSFALNIATTRGCPYKCNWCAKPIYGNRYNTRSPVRVVDEIAYHVTHHQVSSFWMCDDIFGLKPGWVQEFGEELKRRQLHITYKIQSRADLLLQSDNIDALVASGLSEVWIGAESGSQKILDAMDKGTTVDQIRKSSTLLKEKGVKVAFFIQFGYLGETRAEIDQTIALVLDLMPDKLGASVSYPLPGTKFYDKVKDDLVQKANWVDSDDLDMMFQNTYPRSFYKKLHRYLHLRHRVRSNWTDLMQVVNKPLSFRYTHIRKVLALGKNGLTAIFYYYLINRYTA